MERSANTATKENDVTSAAGETLPFDDSNLRGEHLKHYFLSVIKYQRRRNCSRFYRYQFISLYLLDSYGALILLLVKTLINYMKLYQIRKPKLQCSNLVSMVAEIYNGI